METTLLDTANNQFLLFDEPGEYEGFVGKFKPKKTTDDCYTPPEIYNVIAGYAIRRYNLGERPIVRPFWPGGDYKKTKYPADCVVLDNPPFSLLTDICTFYIKSGIKFFLFAPTLTCLVPSKLVTQCNHLICHTDITYENGVSVNTSFVTNLDEDGTIAESCPELGDLINETNARLVKAGKNTVPKYDYPDHVITAAKLNWYAAHGTVFRVRAPDAMFIRALDAQRERGKSLFGGGFLLSERAAAERAAAERAAAERAAAIPWALSDREWEIVAGLGESGGV